MPDDGRTTTDLRLRDAVAAGPPPSPPNPARDLKEIRERLAAQLVEADRLAGVADRAAERATEEAMRWRDAAANYSRALTALDPLGKGA